MKLIKLFAKRNFLNYKRFQYATYYCDKYEKELAEKEKNTKNTDYQKQVINMLYRLDKKHDELDKKLYELKIIIQKFQEK